jgi:hypothetical protein
VHRHVPNQLEADDRKRGLGGRVRQRGTLGPPRDEHRFGELLDLEHPTADEVVAASLVARERGEVSISLDACGSTLPSAWTIKVPLTESLTPTASFRKLTPTSCSRTRYWARVPGAISNRVGADGACAQAVEEAAGPP